MPTWPVGLPQAPEPAGYVNKERDNVLRSPVGYGPDKTRLRTSFAIRDVSMQFFLDNTDAGSLDTFYETTLLKVNTFTWIDHRNDAAATYRFKAPPIFMPFGSASWWDVSLELEIIG